MYHDLNVYHEDHMRNDHEISKLKSESPVENLLSYYAPILKHMPVERIFETIPRKVYHFYKQIVKSASYQPTLDSKIYFHEYTLGEYHIFWTIFSALMCDVGCQ